MEPQTNIQDSDWNVQTAQSVFSVFDTGASFVTLPPDIEKDILGSAEAKALRDAYIAKYSLVTSAPEGGKYVIYAISKNVQDVITADTIEVNSVHFDEILGKIFKDLYNDIKQKSIHDTIAFLLHTHEALLSKKIYYSATNTVIPVFFTLLGGQGLQVASS